MNDRTFQLWFYSMLILGGVFGFSGFHIGADGSWLRGFGFGMTVAAAAASCSRLGVLLWETR